MNRVPNTKYKKNKYTGRDMMKQGGHKASRKMARPTQSRKKLSEEMQKMKRKKYFGGGSGDGFTEMRKAKMAYGSGGKARKAYAHGGKGGYGSVQDMEKACNKMVGMNTMDMKGEK